MHAGRHTAAPTGDVRRGWAARTGLVVLDKLVLPCAVWWVCRREATILRSGVSLDAVQLSLARAVGVAAPECVRVMTAARVPLPLPHWMCRMAHRLGWLSADIAGMTLGYGIVLRGDCRDDYRLLAHELAHVAQYERYSTPEHPERRGRHAGFLRRYLRECVWPGYPYGPLEIEASCAEAVAERYSGRNGATSDGGM